VGRCLEWRMRTSLPRPHCPFYGCPAVSFPQPRSAAFRVGFLRSPKKIGSVAKRFIWQAAQPLMDSTPAPRTTPIFERSMDWMMLPSSWLLDVTMKILYGETFTEMLERRGNGLAPSGRYY